MNDFETINREISWLQFNERVLQEALDPRNPLLERIRFLGIFSNNRDEFFKVRVATIKRLIKLNEKLRPEEAMKTKETLEEILKFVEKQEIKFTKSFIDLQNELEKNNIYFVDETEIDEDHSIFLKKYFREEVRPVIFPIILDKFEGGSKLKDKAIYLAIQLIDSSGIQKKRHALIEIPTGELPRFVKLPSHGEKHYLMFLDDVIRYNLGDIFSIYGYDQFSVYTIKFTRDSELDIDNDVSKSFLEIMSESVKKRKKGLPVRFIYDKEIPEDLLKNVIKKLHIPSSNVQLRGGGRYHNFKDFINFPVFSKELTYKPQPPVNHPCISSDKSFFDLISKSDILLNFPYHPFQHIIDFLREASIDPQVKSIKMTFYRAARKSKVMNALINAARNGKAVTVFIELQARFDEKDNIFWAQKLQDEGVKVLQTIPGVKVHAKMIIIKRKENGKNKYYANISTGNFNEVTARIYSDISILTDNQVIARDLNNLFHLLEFRYIPMKFDSLYVSPFGIRGGIQKMINREIRNVRQGKEAWMILKVNNLVDEDIAERIYNAATEGVKIKLLIRGINVIKIGKGNSCENIEARSIVGRYLEHSRVFVFANGGNPEYFISSADLMTRNLDHRFEIMCPIYDPKIKDQLKDLLEIQWRDNEKSRSLNWDKINNYIVTDSNLPQINTHEATYEYFKKMKK